MDNGPATAKSSTMSPSSASPWVAYFLGKNAPADRFLREMEEGVITIPDETTGKPKKVKTRVISIPDDAAINFIVEAISAKPNRISRLVLLLQKSVTSVDTIRHIVLDLAEACIKHLGFVSFPDPSDSSSFYHAASKWLAGIRKRPLKPAQINILFLLLHYGCHRQLLDQDSAFRLVASAVSKSTKPKAKQPQPTKSTPIPIKILLTAQPAVPVLSSLIDQFEASRAMMKELNAQIQSQQAEIDRLKNECTALNATITRLQDEFIELRNQKVTAEDKIAELEKQIVDTHDGYQHKLNELRGRIRGTMQGQLSRWLQTALDASLSDPPWTVAIQERLEDALKLIEKEIIWLQPSA